MCIRDSTKRAISDFQRGPGRWTSKSNHRWRTCVEQGWTEIKLWRYWGWFVVRTLYVRERSLYLMLSFILSQCRDLRTGVIFSRPTLLYHTPLSRKLLQCHTNWRQSHSTSSMHLKIGWLISISHSRRLVLLQFYCTCADAYNKRAYNKTKVC